MEVTVRHHACGSELEVETPGLGHPDACPNCGCTVDPHEVLADGIEAANEQDKAEAERVRREQVRRQGQTPWLPH